jgi:polyisoprenoid-binding protein YceI
MSQQTWQIDSTHSGIHFSVRHLMIAKVRGQFGRWTGTITAPDGDFDRASVTVTIDATSIDTGVADRDAHLKSEDFFAVETYPEITFKGAIAGGFNGGQGQLDGELTMHGVTQPVRLEAELAGQTKDPWGNQRAVFSAKGSLDRKAFGLTWNQALETGGVMVGETVEISIEIEAVQQVEADAAAAG